MNRRLGQNQMRFLRSFTVGAWVVMTCGIGFQAWGAVIDLSPSLQSVQVRYSLGQLYCSVFDPQLGREVEEVVSTGVPANLSTNQGVVTWSSGGQIFVRLYDLSRTNWARFQTSAVPYRIQNVDGVVAWSEKDAVRAVVYDPGIDQWVHQRWSSGPTYNLQTTNGVVAWSSGSTVFYAAYDPLQHQWIAKYEESGPTYDLGIRSGVVAWTGAGQVHYRTYDPSRGKWMGGDAPAGSVSNLRNADGVVAWTYGNTVYGVLYDPRSGQWIGFQEAQSGIPSNLQIQQGTVSWVIPGRTVQRGFSPAEKQWGEGPTLPLAFFLVSTNHVNAPVDVVFVDLSIAGWLWQWDFGDGTQSWRRAPVHRLESIGKFPVRLVVANGHGMDSFQQDLITDANPPIGTVVINHGARWTTNRVVTLQLSAEDDSGGVIQVRIRNLEEEWSDWEPLTSERIWTLSEGDGWKTVEVQFKDPYGNMSDPVRASIQLDTTPPPVVHFAVTETNVAEKIGTFQVQILLSHPFTRLAKIHYETVPESAQPGINYVFAGGDLYFQPGMTNWTIQLQILDNDLVETNKTFLVRITALQDAIAGPPLRVRILDDDPTTAQVELISVEFLESVGVAKIPIKLLQPSGMEVWVPYVVTNGTAQPGLDYVPGTGFVHFAPGQTQAFAPVMILDNTLDQTNRTVFLRLLEPTNAVLGVYTETVIYIKDNDPPTARFLSSEIRWRGQAGEVEIPVCLSKPWKDMVLVDYATIAGGTAKPGIDYVSTAGTLIFSPGETQRSIRIPILQNPNRTQEKVFLVQLQNAVNGSIGFPSLVKVHLIPSQPLRLEVLSVEPEGLRLRAFGPSGATVVVECSKDLIHWDPVRTVTLSKSGITEWTEPFPSHAPEAFYRLMTKE